MKKLTLILAAILVTASFGGCTKNGTTQPEVSSDIIESTPENESVNDSAENEIVAPEEENKKEEAVSSENYADSELYDFTGTIDEIYEDGSILVFSPDFRVLNYNVIVEFDENSVIDGFELAKNQHIRLEVYSQAKNTDPLTVVAAKLTLISETSTQHEEEEQRIKELQEKAEALMAKQ
ncbi:MAG: hypothetical protein IKU43_02995 [Clostridia bacterium]|nr:hypothetical protein [Clostridia bacterium]